MKVVYVLSSYKALGGASKAFKSMLSGLMQLGIEPLVVMPGHGELTEELEQMGVQTLSLNYRFATYPEWNTLRNKILFIPRLLFWQCLNMIACRKLLHLLRGKGIALIHTNVGVVDVGFHVARQLGIPHIYHIREYADLDFNLHYFPTKRCFHHQLSAPASYSICITKDIQNHHGQATFFSSRVIYDGIQSAKEVCPPFKMGESLLFAGRIEHTKGLDILLKAYAKCMERDIIMPSLLVAGRLTTGRYLDNILELIRQHHLSSLVKILGERSDIEILMRKARALVVPSRHEGFGLCMPEAMFNRCLVIAHDTAGTHEQLENGVCETGLDIALRFNTIDQLADCLIQVCNSSSHDYDEMTKRAFNVVNQLYSIEAHVSRVFQFYQDILKAERRNRE